MNTVLERTDDDGVVWLILDRPAALNALTVELVSELHAILARLADDRSCRVVVLTGAGRGFCAGLDLTGYGGPPDDLEYGQVHQTLAVQRHIVGLVQRIRRMPQVVIAAVNGAAAGGGLALVLACDIRLAADSAIFAVAFIRVGVTSCDIGTSWLLPRIVGAGTAHELMITGRRFDAAEALRIGLLADVVASGQLLERADQAARDCLAADPFGLALTKRGMWLALETPFLEGPLPVYTNH